LILKLIEIGSAGPTENIFMNIRLALIGGDLDDVPNQLGVLNYLSYFAIFGAGFHALGVVRSSKRKVIFLVSIALIYALLSTGRTYSLLLFCLIAGGLAISRKVNIVKLVLSGCLVFTAIFISVAFFLEKGIGLGDNLLVEAGLAIKEYYLGGVTGLNDYLASPHMLDMGENTFRTVMVVLNKFDEHIIAPPLVKEFRSVPLWTNVYSVFRPYYQDFGWAGVIISQTIFGFVHSLTYYRALQNRAIWIYCYGLLLYPLVMQFFQDQYFSLLSTWVKGVVLILIIIFIPRLKMSMGYGQKV
jgi:oligosaccharide repeat unit polymerase